MKATIYSLNTSEGYTPEEGVCAKFLQWQGCEKIHFVQDMSIMKKNGGTGIPVITLGDEITAVGFDDLYEQMNKKGLRLC